MDLNKNQGGILTCTNLKLPINFTPITQLITYFHSTLNKHNTNKLSRSKWQAQELLGL